MCKRYFMDIFCVIRKKARVIYENILFIVSFDWIKTKKIKKHFYINDVYMGNSFYGISKGVREYANFKPTIKACFEHGVYFGDNVISGECETSGLPAIITMGDFRRKYIRKKTDKPIFSIGPYIYYVKSFFGLDVIENMKGKNGKTLLFFPTHSREKLQSKIDFEKICEKIDNIKKQYNFNTVIVSLYWKDYESDYKKKYTDKGYMVVTSGYLMDETFLQKQKSYILMSDYTISNGVGTHVGYCIALGKPHWIIDFSNNYIVKDGNKMKDVAPELLLESNKKEKKEVYNVFCKYSEKITQEQKEICDKYWGINLHKDKNELRSIFELINKLYILQILNKKNKNYKYKILYDKSIT